MENLKSFLFSPPGVPVFFWWGGGGGGGNFNLLSPWFSYTCTQIFVQIISKVWEELVNTIDRHTEMPEILSSMMTSN